MTEPRQLLTPHRDLVMVLEDEVSDRTSSGLFVPDGSVAPSTGKILDVGPLTPAEYHPGRRVLYRPRAGSLVGYEGISKDGAIRFLHPSQILAFLDGEQAEDSELWAKQAQAPPGWLLVERVEIPLQRGRVILPDGARVHVRSNESIVRSIGDGVSGYWLGQRVTINGPLGDELRFGDRGQVRLWRIAPDMTQATVHVPDESLRVYGESPMETADLSFVDSEESLAFDEGDPRGVQ